MFSVEFMKFAKDYVALSLRGLKHIYIFDSQRIFCFVCLLFFLVFFFIFVCLLFFNEILD